MTTDDVSLLGDEDLDNIDVGEDEDKEELEDDDREVIDTRRKAEDVHTERPEWLPDELWDKDANDIKKGEVLKALETERKRTTDLRKIISKGGQKAPESVDEYQIEVDEDMKGFVPDDDPMLGVAKNAALKNGISKEAFEGFVKDYLSGGKENGIFDPANLPKSAEEIEADNKAFRESEMKKLGDEGKKIFTQMNHDFATALKSGEFNADEKQAYLNAVYNAAGVTMMHKFAALARSGKFGNGEVIPLNSDNPDGVPSISELDTMNKDRDRKRNDPEYRKKIQEGYRYWEKQGVI